MFGVLVDVSGSMKSAYALDKSHHVNTERTHAIFTSIMNIVKKEVDRHERQELIFASAFGLENSPGTCDLLRLLDYFADLKKAQDNLPEHYEPSTIKEVVESPEFQEISEVARKHLHVGPDAMFGSLEFRAVARKHGGPDPMSWMFRSLDQSHKDLIELALRHNASHAEPWIEKHLSPLEARVVHSILTANPELIPDVVNRIPGIVGRTAVKTFAWMG